MDIQAFKKLNRILGLLMGLIATAVYVMTMESSASLWDCGEFIAACYKQMVVHPPGAPLFVMIGRMFTLLAGGDVTMVAYWMNFMSALCSGLSIMFLFWIVTHLGKRMMMRMKLLNSDAMIPILGGGVVAALAGTFCTSIWFSAVEAEVYSMSLLFTAIVVWAICQWDERADDPQSDRWLLFIAFTMGCSIFVHWLNLLAIPALAFVYYFRRFEVTTKGAFAALGVSILILGFILYGVITGFITLAAKIELMMVNSFGLPFNSGVILFFSLLIAAIVFALYYTYKKRMALAHNIALCITFMLIGYSTLTTVVIRSNANPNINMNAPKDIVSLSSYLLREQYGNRPFLRGHYYTSRPEDYKSTGKKYARGKDKYEVVGEKLDYVYNDREKKVLFPRIYDSNFTKDYERWLGLRPGQKPSYADNLKFFFKYQIGHMYFRYLMWNFTGRQNDEQGFGAGDMKNGNWLSGIGPIDSFFLGSQSNLPEYVENHPVRNTYYFLPFLLGLFGLVFHAHNDRRRFTAIMLLFLFTGIMIIIQGNSPPVEPRERDYIFAGSFYAFTIWLGIGVMGIWDLLRSKINGKTAGVIALAIGLVPPLIMGYQNWDDHNRSGRTAARDFARNYLESCEENAIIFTQGDNDTYPLWYAQEVEGIRPDVRVVNLSLLGVDWYIEQIAVKVNEAAPVPMSMYKLNPDGSVAVNKIRGTERDAVPYIENPEVAPPGRSIELKQIMEFIGDKKYAFRSRGEETNYYPTQNFKITVDTTAWKNRSEIHTDDKGKIAPALEWKMGKRTLLKNDLMVLDIIAQNAANGWDRPIYFAISVNPSSYMGLQKYFQLEGLAYRLIPVEKSGDDPYTGSVNSDIMYDNVVNKFTFGNIERPGIHVDSDLKRMLFNFRSNFARLAGALVEKGDTEKAVALMDRCQEIMPNEKMPYDMYWFPMIETYYDAKAPEKAAELTRKIAKNISEDAKYYRSLSGRYARSFEKDRQQAEQVLDLMARISTDKKQPDLAEEIRSLMM